MLKRRRTKAEEARVLAEEIIQAAQRAQAQGGLRSLEFEGIPYSKLPPETLGMICHTLIASFIDSFEEHQETALLIVLSTVSSWKKFFEVLEHMTDDGSTVDPMRSLTLICSLLDNSLGTDQLSEFLDWIIHLGNAQKKMPKLAWTKTPIDSKRDIIVARLSRLESNIGVGVLA